MTKYLALDQSLRTSGYAIFEDDKLDSWGIFTTNPKHDVGKRLRTIIENIEEIIQEEKIEYLFFEDIQNQANNQTYKSLAHVQGAIYLLCAAKGIQYTVLSPSHWRSILKEKCGIKFGRKRTEQKEIAINFVRQRYNKEVSSDEADAICLGLAGILENGKNESAF